MISRNIMFVLLYTFVTDFQFVGSYTWTKREGSEVAMWGAARRSPCDLSLYMRVVKSRGFTNCSSTGDYRNVYRILFIINYYLEHREERRAQCVRLAFVFLLQGFFSSYMLLRTAIPSEVIRVFIQSLKIIWIYHLLIETPFRLIYVLSFWR
jgi:hypothetical protein